MRYGVCDIGTNSCRLLIAEVAEDRLETLERRVVSTRIGEGMQATGWLKPQAIARTLDCLTQFTDEMRRWQVSESIVVATSAVRDAANCNDFLILAQEKCGVNIKILSGEDEAKLNYLGVKKSLKQRLNPLVVDVGGGSTEIAVKNRKIISSSVKVGAVRATEADWSEDHITKILKDNISDDLLKATNPMVLVGGTATSMVAIRKGLRVYNADEVQGETVELKDVDGLYRQLADMTPAQRRGLPGLQPERADIIVKGMLIIKSVMELFDRDQAIISDSDLLHGIIWHMVEGKSI